MDIISNYHYFKALRRGEATKGVRTDGKEEGADSNMGAPSTLREARRPRAAYEMLLSLEVAH